MVIITTLLLYIYLRERLVLEIIFLLILGVVQGLTEFLPVSSSGHLVLLSNFFGITDSLFVSILLHIATLLSILVVLRKDVWQLVRHPFSDKSMKLMVATVPTCILALIFMPLIHQSFSGSFLGICFFISAIVLLFADYTAKKHTQNHKAQQKSFVTDKWHFKRKDKNIFRSVKDSRELKVDQDKTYQANNLNQQKKSDANEEKQADGITYKNAIIMGIAQGFATFPGVSRSGSTISAGLLSGGSKQDTAKFSFLMSIPIIILSMILEIYKFVVQGEVVQVNVPGLILAFVFAFIIGVLSIRWMLKLTSKANFKWFSLYLIGMTILSLFMK